MKLDAQKLFFPLTIFAAVVGIWAAFRNNNGGTNLSMTLPNPASSGVTPSADTAPVTYAAQPVASNSVAATTQAATDPTSNNPGSTASTSASYPPANVPYIATSIPSDAQNALTSAYGGLGAALTAVPDPNGNSVPVPSYLTHNFGPRHALTKPMPVPSAPSSGGCGGSCGMAANPSCNTCNQKNAFPDGSGNSQLSSSSVAQFANSDSEQWLDSYAKNAAAYLASAPPNTNGWSSEYK